MKRGIHAIYKPKGITSYDVIRRLKKLFPGEKIGHGGTLDPLAEGVLVVGVGREATRQLQQVLKGTEKEYDVVVKLGQTSETDDSEGPIKDHPHAGKVAQPSQSEVEKVLHTFLGEIDQVPPKYSAVKLKGKTAYARARKGEEIVLEPKRVIIQAIELVDFEYPLLTLRVVTGSGVYVRSLARDIGRQLGVGGYVQELKRTRVGDFDLVKALQLGELE